MDVITYDLATIEHAQQGLARLAGDYRAAGDDLEHVERALGSPDVERAIVDFVDDWKRRRDKQVAMSEAGQQALVTIREAYVEIDSEGARALQQGNP